MRQAGTLEHRPVRAALRHRIELFAVGAPAVVGEHDVAAHDAHGLRLRLAP
jgi:hypothetical protein